MTEPKPTTGEKAAIPGYGTALTDAYKAIAAAAVADARTSLDARRALFALRSGRDIPADVAEVLEVLAAFERSLIEEPEERIVEQRREECLQAMDRLMVDRGIPRKVS